MKKTELKGFIAALRDGLAQAELKIDSDDFDGAAKLLKSMSVNMADLASLVSTGQRVEPKSKPPSVIYLALHEAGLRNGSFYRRTNRTRKWAEYINGDYMGSITVRPQTYADQPLKEFDKATAERLIPPVCK